MCACVCVCVFVREREREREVCKYEVTGTSAPHNHKSIKDREIDEASSTKFNFVYDTIKFRH